MFRSEKVFPSAAAGNELKPEQKGSGGDTKPKPETHRCLKPVLIDAENAVHTAPAGGARKACQAAKNNNPHVQTGLSAAAGDRVHHLRAALGSWFVAPSHELRPAAYRPGFNALCTTVPSVYS